MNYSLQIPPAQSFHKNICNGSKKMSVGKCLTAWRAVKPPGRLGLPEAACPEVAGVQPPRPYGHSASCRLQSPGCNHQKRHKRFIGTDVSQASPCTTLISKMNTTANQLDLSQPSEAIYNTLRLNCNIHKTDYKMFHHSSHVLCSLGISLRKPLRE